jgi:hypothetical protein
MFEPIWFLPAPIVIIWLLIKCHFEVESANIDDDWEADKLFWKCVIEDLVPLGLPDPDRFDDEE